MTKNRSREYYNEVKIIDKTHVERHVYGIVIRLRDNRDGGYGGVSKMFNDFKINTYKSSVFPCHPNIYLSQEKGSEYSYTRKKECNNRHFIFIEKYVGHDFYNKSFAMLILNKKLPSELVYMLKNTLIGP